MSLREYIDFKLYLTAAPDGKGACQVALLPTPEVGETTAPVVVPAERAPKQELLAQLAQKSITARQWVELGKSLADCLLPEGTIRERFKCAYDRAGLDGGVRLRAIIGDHSLKPLPWEYLYYNMLGGPDSIRGFLLLDPRISLVRHEPLPFPHPTLLSTATELGDLRILVAGASPVGAGLPPLKLGREIQYIKKATGDVTIGGVRIASQLLANVTRSDLMQALTGPEPIHFFHFIGHGITRTKADWFAGGALKDEGCLVLLADKKKKTKDPMPADDVARLLQQAGVRLAVLGACYSGWRDARYPWDSVACALTAHEIPAVVAMQYEVINTHAEAFGEAFYRVLASGMSLDEAMTLGRLAMLGVATSAAYQVNLEWGVPVLYSRSPTGAVFPERIERAQTSAERLGALIDRAADHVSQTGEVIGMSIEKLRGGKEISLGGIQVNQTVGTVEPGGRVIGVQIERLG
jgi:hypothetical protein